MLCKERKSSASEKNLEESCVRGRKRLSGMKNLDSKLHSFKKMEAKKKQEISHKPSMIYKNLDTSHK